MDYEKAYKEALEKIREGLQPLPDGAKISGVTRAFLEEVFPELAESKDEKIRKALINLFATHKDYEMFFGASVKNIRAWLEKQKEIDKEIVFRPLAGTDIIAAARQALEKIEIGKEVVLAFNGAYIHVNGKTVAEICNEYFAWTEKQGELKPILNVPSREVILAIWDLGNEWKELTDGRISTKYGTTLDYIQKHWHESEYYLREKQGEQKPTWSEEDEEILKNLIDYFSLDDGLRLPTEETIDWLKSLKKRLS